MTGYLLDTSVISTAAPGRSALDDRVADWLRENTAACHLSVVTVTEIQQGICKLRRTGGNARADALSSWLDNLPARFGRRVLALDHEIARAAGKLSDSALALGRHPGFADIFIAATASARGLTVLTRNTRHFEPLGILAADPFAPDFPPR